MELREDPDQVLCMWTDTIHFRSMRTFLYILAWRPGLADDYAGTNVG